MEDIDAKLEGLIDLYREDRERTALLLNTLLGRIRPTAEAPSLIDMSPTTSPTHRPLTIEHMEASTSAGAGEGAGAIPERSNSGAARGRLGPPLSARPVRSASQHAGPAHVEPPLKPLKSILVNSSSNIPTLNLSNMNESVFSLSSTPVSTPPITPPTAQIPEIDSERQEELDEQTAAASSSSRALSERDSLTVGQQEAVERRPSTLSATTSGNLQPAADDAMKRPIARNLSDLGPGPRRKHVTIGRSRLIEHSAGATETPNTPEHQSPPPPPPPVSERV